MLNVIITTHHKFVLEKHDSPLSLARRISKEETFSKIKRFARELPEHLLCYRNEFGLSEDTPDRISVELAEFSPFSVNVPNMQVRVEFNENLPTPKDQSTILDNLRDFISDWFEADGYDIREDLLVELRWITARGKGYLLGTLIEW